MTQGSVTRNRILDAAHRLILKKGLDRTSVGDVLEAARVRKGTFYHHFEDKQALGLAVLEKDRDAFLEFVATRLDAGSPLAGIRRFLRDALKQHRDRGFVGGCLWGNTALEMSDSNPVFSERAASLFASWKEALRTSILSAQRAGEIRSKRPAVELAESSIATLEGGIMLSRLTKSDRALRAAIRAIEDRLDPVKPAFKQGTLIP